MAVNSLAVTTAAPGAVPALPASARTSSGVIFDPRSERWAFRDSLTSVSVNFLLLQKTTPELRLSVKAALLWYAENHAAGTMETYFSQLVHFFRLICVGIDIRKSEITSHDILNYRAALGPSSPSYLGGLSGFLKKWHELGYPGITDDAVALLRQLRIPGGPKGLAVRTMDPVHGPFSDIEVDSIRSELDLALSNGRINAESHLLVFLYMMLGSRPIQIAALKVSDVGQGQSSDGTVTYTLRVPRAKQHFQQARAEFKNRVLIPQIGRLLVEQAQRVRGECVDKLIDPSNLPLFPAKRRIKNEPHGFEFHRTAASLRGLLETSLRPLAAMSERTGRPLNITAARFRKTVGTRAAVEGYGELIIAELLDHSDTQNVGVYVEAVPGILKRIDKAMAMHLAPMAQAFAGVLIENESQALRAGDPSSRICDPRFDPSMRPIGNCGKHGFCGSLAPISCYTCGNFQPWLDGPHEAVLTHLISERERLVVATDFRVASINDRTILAVAQVVSLCQGALNAREGGSGG